MGKTIMLCDYGCGQEAKYQFKNGKWCCSKNQNSCPKIREKHKESAKSTFKKGHTPWNKGNVDYLTDELRFRMGEKNIGRDGWNKGKTEVYSERSLKLMSESRKGKSPWNKGLKNCYSAESIKRMSKAHKGYKATRSHKNKLRIVAIKRIENRYGQCIPNYNPIACKLIDEYGKQNNYNFQHAENGGEYYIKELGYWVDGYDKEKNVVIEIDEEYHFDVYGNLKIKDIKRQKEIENYLNCKFIRARI